MGPAIFFYKGRDVNSVIISPRADCSWGRHFNVTPASWPLLDLTAHQCCSPAAVRAEKLRSLATSASHPASQLCDAAELAYWNQTRHDPATWWCMLHVVHRAATWSLKSPKISFSNTWSLMSLILKKWSLKSLFLCNWLFFNLSWVNFAFIF